MNNSMIYLDTLSSQVLKFVDCDKIYFSTFNFNPSIEASMQVTLNSTHEWFWDPTYGFFGDLSSFLTTLDAWTSFVKPSSLLIDGGCPLNTIHFLGMIDIRLPLIFVFSIIGQLLGFGGFLAIRAIVKNNGKSSKIKKLQNTCLFDLAISFLFFGFMNLSGLFFHCFLPIVPNHTSNTIELRQILHLTDQISTGISGIFLGTGIYGLVKQSVSSRQMNNSMTIKFAVIISILSLGIIVFFLNRGGLFTDLIYLIGMQVGISYFIGIFRKTREDYPIELVKCVNTVVIAIGFLVIAFFGQKYICDMTNGIWSVGASMFALSDVCFFAVYWYCIQFLQQIPKSD